MSLYGAYSQDRLHNYWPNRMPVDTQQYFVET